LDNVRPLRLVPGIHRATHRIALFLERAEPPLGVSHGEAHLLAHLVEVGACSVNDLFLAFAHKRSTLTSLLDRLETARLVRREVHPGDRRSFLVFLTARGEKTAQRVRERLAKLERVIVSRVPAGATAGFDAVLAAVQEITADQGGGPARSGRTKRARASGDARRSGE
jgi:DNA-binding MarR family transcriptional regulator